LSYRGRYSGKRFIIQPQKGIFFTNSFSKHLSNANENKYQLTCLQDKQRPTSLSPMQRKGKMKIRPTQVARTFGGVRVRARERMQLEVSL